MIEEPGGIPTENATIPRLRQLEVVNDAIRDLLKRPFFEWVVLGAISSQQGRIIAEQYYAASLRFPEALACAIASGANELIKSVIVENLWDEFGNGDKANFHRLWLRKFVESLGGDVEQISVLPKTTAYIRGIKTLCKEGSEGEVLGALGPGCECFTPAQYSLIVEGFRKSRLCTANDMEFFTNHIAHDKYHIKPLMELIEAEGNKNGFSQIVAGAIQAIAYENILWEGIEEAIGLR